jgi:hypothetical protein
VELLKFLNLEMSGEIRDVGGALKYAEKRRVIDLMA